MNNGTNMVRMGIGSKLRQSVKTYAKPLKMLAGGVAGYLMSNAFLFGSLAPFGVAFTAAASGDMVFGCALGAILGYLFSLGLILNMKYIAAILLILGARALFKGRGRALESAAFAPLSAFACMGLPVALLILWGDATLYDLMTGIAEMTLTAGAAYFFHRAMKSAGSGLTGMNRSDLSCVVISFAILVTALSSMRIETLNLGGVVAVSAILFSARYGGEAAGTVAGVALGMAVGIATGDYSRLIVGYSLGGLGAGVFSRAGRLATAGAFLIINSLSLLLGASRPEIVNGLLENFIASVLFVAVPSSVMSRFRVRRHQAASPEGSVVTQTITDRLGRIANAMRGIGDTTRQVSEKLDRLTGDDLDGVYMRVGNKVCGHCGMKSRCWQSNYQDTMNVINDAMLLLRKQGKIMIPDLPEYFSQRCCRRDDFVQELNLQFGEYVSREGVRQKVSKIRSVVTDQFEGMALMMDQMADEIRMIRVEDTASAAKAAEYFRKRGIEAVSATAIEDDYGRVTLEVIIPSHKAARIKLEEATADLCDILERDLDLPMMDIGEKEAAMTFTERAAFVVEYGLRQITCSGNRLCGDCCEILGNTAGKSHVILSDGMGSGGSAAVDSAMTVGLIRRLLTAGVDHEAALKMVNSALLIKSGEESLSTVDIATVDLHTGKALFYKAGAAPTFVLKGGRAGYVQSTSLPAGILRGVTFEQSAINLKDGDMVLMVSDGAVASGADWVGSELENIRDMSVQRIADRIAETARSRRIDGREDDITVAVLLLKKGL